VPTALESSLEQPLEHEIDPEVQKELLDHPGKWAAITRSRVIAIGDTALEVQQKAAKAGEKNPILYRVPDGTRSHFF
jgi:hypothetical protein